MQSMKCFLLVNFLPTGGSVLSGSEEETMGWPVEGIKRVLNICFQ